MCEPVEFVLMSTKTGLQELASLNESDFKFFCPAEVFEALTEAFLSSPVLEECYYYTLVSYAGSWHLLLFDQCSGRLLFQTWFLFYPIALIESCTTVLEFLVEEYWSSGDAGLYVIARQALRDQSTE